MSTIRRYSRRIWTVLILILVMIGQVEVVSAFQPEVDSPQHRPGCVIETRVDSEEYWRHYEADMPSGNSVKWETVCFAEGEVAAQQLKNTLAGYQSICGIEVRVDPRDYYPIDGIGVPTGRNATWQVVCAP